MERRETCVSNLLSAPFRNSMMCFFLNFTKYRFRPDFIFNYVENLATTVVPAPIEGKVYVGVSLLGWPEPTFSGDGILCHLEFTAIHAGHSPLSISNVILINSIGNCTGATFHRPSGEIDVELIANNNTVTIEPSYQVISWNFTSKPNKMDFNFSVFKGVSHCRICVPVNVMDGPFQIVIDNNLTNKIGYSLEFNATHAFIDFDYDLEEGIHNIKVIEGISMCVWGDIDGNGEVNIVDLYHVAKNFGKKCDR